MQKLHFHIDFFRYFVHDAIPVIITSHSQHAQVLFVHSFLVHMQIWDVIQLGPRRQRHQICFL